MKIKTKQSKNTVAVKSLSKGASLAANLSSIPRIHVVEGENRLLQVVL